MLIPGLQCEEIDDVDGADLQLGNGLAQQIDGGERLHGRHVAGAGHDEIGQDGGVLIARPVPDADAGLAMFRRLVHR